MIHDTPQYPEHDIHDNTTKTAQPAGWKHWRDIVAKYQSPSHLRSMWQLVNSLVPFTALLLLMYWSLGYSYLIALALSVPAAGFLVRIFIISHDCGHGAFFKSTRANNIVGVVTGFLCCTPYYYWKHEHALHHASAGNLDKRGHGDIWTMTVREYQAAPWRRRLAYRLYRNPLVLFGIGSAYLFLVEYRIPPRNGSDRDRRSVWRTNLALAAVVLLAAVTVGLKAFLMVQLPVMILAAAAGAWLFYVQHQFEGVYWARNKEWDYVAGCLQGSSYYRLPKLFQWFTGNIGFHHIHHLSAKIPNYYLEKCHRDNVPLQQVHQLSLWSSINCLRYRLWCDETEKLVTFRDVRKRQRAA
jgi:acyl-lipid omega-6 desaturase (Delta-12 desaturase)